MHRAAAAALYLAFAAPTPDIDLARITGGDGHGRADAPSPKNADRTCHAIFIAHDVPHD
jgi:hypothetical protein